ncbi:MAG: hypothetical protein WDN44_05170 [Sphingomonas sp.]
MNQGSTAMQCPPTPAPGRRIETRGWRLASAIARHTSIPRSSQISDNSLAKAMLTSRYEFSTNLTSSAVRLSVRMHSALTNPS